MSDNPFSGQISLTEKPINFYQICVKSINHMRNHQNYRSWAPKMTILAEPWWALTRIDMKIPKNEHQWWRNSGFFCMIEAYKKTYNSEEIDQRSNMQFNDILIEKDIWQLWVWSNHKSSAIKTVNNNHNLIHFSILYQKINLYIEITIHISI